MANIRRNLALKMLDVKETPDGKQVVHAVKFVKANGELVFLPRAIVCGLNRNLAENRERGFMPVDADGKKIGHVYPVNIDCLIELNNLKIVF